LIENIKYVEMDGKRYLMPSHLQIEVVGGKGMCNAHCAMCTIDKWERPPTIMSDAVFQGIMDGIAPFNEHIEYVTLHGNGEPLLDKAMAGKVRYAKQKGFKGVGFATNCSALTKKRADELIAAGLDTIICSIDGMKKETHEAIRPGTKFESVVRNVKYLIQARNRSGKTKILVRFIRQELNQHEFPEYKAYWDKYLNPEFGDEVLVFNIHNWGSQLEVGNQINESFGHVHEEIPICADLYHRLLVFPNGDLAFCDADYNGFYDLGNVQKEHFLKLYNGERLNFYRQKMESGKIRELPYCKSCTIPISRANKAAPAGSDEKAPPVSNASKVIPIVAMGEKLPL
jgi:radical SAM protein with 4Fe4S-binding SPASM domain